MKGHSRSVNNFSLARYLLAFTHIVSRSKMKRNIGCRDQLGIFFFSSTKLFFFQMNIFLFEYRQDKSVAEMMFSGSHQTQNFLCSCLRVVFPRAVSRVIHSLFAKLRQKFFFGRKRDEFGKLLSSRNCNFADSRVTISSG